jgi:membrane-bound lytic murein transglycosylase A
MFGRARHLLSFALLGLMVACGGRSDPPPVVHSAPPVIFTPRPVLSVTSLPGWAAERKSLVVAAFATGCDRMDASFATACKAAKAVFQGDEQDAQRFLEENFNAIYLGANQVTGYFEVTVPGSLRPDSRFRIPVLRAPASPDQFSRNEILSGALAGKGLELLYLQSEADLYFLQLQGSGRVELTDGRLVRLGTIANNKRPRTPVNDIFSDAGIPGNDLSIPGIRAWAAQHPAETNQRLARDQAYVFFRVTPELSPQYGPYGAFGLPLLPIRSVAVDPREVKLGSLLWLNATNSLDHTQLPRLVLAHDIGDLIDGPARVDMFYGWGPKAEQDGGHENTQGALWALVPR